MLLGDEWYKNEKFQATKKVIPILEREAIGANEIYRLLLSKVALLPRKLHVLRVKEEMTIRYIMFH